MITKHQRIGRGAYRSLYAALVPVRSLLSAAIDSQGAAAPRQEQLQLITARVGLPEDGTWPG